MSARPVVLGVDVGTSSTKAVLVDPEDGTILAQAAREHAVARPRPGHVEQDPEVWWQELRGLSGELAATGDVDVVAVGVSGMGPCAVLTDAAGVPVRPAILYGVDTRAQQQIRELDELLGAGTVVATTGSALTSQAVGPKLRWVADHEPDVYRAADAVTSTAGFLVGRLTGEHVLDRHTASQFTPLYDRAAEAWHPTWTEVVAPGLRLPRLAWAGDVAGVTTVDLPGVRRGTPVTVGTVDAWAEALSVDAHRPGDLMLMYGTTMFLVATTDVPLTQPGLWGTAGLGPGLHCLAGGMATSGAVTAWLRDLTGGASYDVLTAEAEASGVGARGLLMLPYLAGERTPVDDPDARGVLAGFHLGHTRGDLYRAALEATAMGVRHNLEHLRAAGAGAGRVVAVGGGVQGGLWTQVVSDVCGIEQVLPRTTVGASYGMAYLAARARGEADISTWNPPAGLCRPRADATARYDEVYALYRELYPATADVVHALARRQHLPTTEEPQ